MVNQVKANPVASLYLKPSSNPFRKSAFFFPRMRDEESGIAKGYPELVKCEHLGSASPLFCIVSSSCEYYALRLPLLRAGFRRISREDSLLTPPNLLWGRSMPFKEVVDPQTGKKVVELTAAPNTDLEMTYEARKMTLPEQRFNHFPLSHRNVGCKRGLALNLRRLTEHLKQRGSPTPVVEEKFNFVPKTWLYPSEKDALVEEFKNSSSSKAYIWKPARGSCGRGIFITNGGASNQSTWEKLMKEIEMKRSEVTGNLFSQYVVQEYLDHPLLLDGRKMDLRLYVAVTSYNPLIVYLHEEGLVRLAASPYDENVLNKERFKYLTNYSIGRKYKPEGDATALEGSPDPNTSASIVTDVAETEEESLELKWSLSRFHDHIAEHYGPKSLEELRTSIALVIERTLMSVKPRLATTASRVTTPGSFVELYGFDIMLDRNLRPYLVEVNTLPSLESSSPFDYSTKTNVVSDFLNLAQLQPFERDVEQLSLITDNTTILQPPPPPYRGLVQSLTEVRLGGDAPRLPLEEELRCRLLDERETARGFKRLFPPLTESEAKECQSPLSLSTPAVLSDYEMFRRASLLSQEDQIVFGYGNGNISQ